MEKSSVDRDKEGKVFKTLGKIITAGWGDRVIIGFLMGILDDVTPDICYDYIKNDLSLLHWATEEDWQKYRRLAHRANLNFEITRERIIAELRKYHPEHLSIILNTEGGLDWLQKQITEMKQKLELN